MDVHDCLLLQKRTLEFTLKDRYIPRNLDPSKFQNDLIKVIIGPRRAGKSFFAIHMIAQLGSYGYVNFDDETLPISENLDQIIAEINLIYNQPQYILMDEIQNVPKWELWVNRLQRERYNLILTGSNANLLAEELSTHLTGRHLRIEIFPFSFREFLTIDPPLVKTTGEIQACLSEYLQYGGYPEPKLKKLDYHEYFRLLLDSVIYTDIIKRFRIKNFAAIEKIVAYFFSNIGNKFSFQTISGLAGCSVVTAQRYLAYLEMAFIFFTLQPFSLKMKQELTAQKKCYCYDQGFITQKMMRLTNQKGKLFENLIALSLKQEEFSHDMRLFYWSTAQQGEVDFVVYQRDQITHLIQVSLTQETEKTKTREIRGLLKAKQELKCDNLIIITENTEKREDAKWYGLTGTIQYIPAWKWLTQAHSLIEP